MSAQHVMPRRWYQEPLVWMLIAIPGSAVVMGAVMLTLATSTYDGLVADDYYKRGLQINRSIAREKHAASHGIAAKQDKKVTYDLDVVFKNSSEVRVNLKRNSKAVRKLTVKSDNFENLLVKLNSTIIDKVLVYKKTAIEIASATVTPRSTVDYGNLISTLDVLRKNKIVNIGVLTARGQ